MWLQLVPSGEDSGCLASASALHQTHRLPKPLAHTSTAHTTLLRHASLPTPTSNYTIFFFQHFWQEIIINHACLMNLRNNVKLCFHILYKLKTLQVKIIKKRISLSLRAKTYFR